MAERSKGGEMGGGPRVQVSDLPTGTPLATSKKGMDSTVEPRTLDQGTLGGGEKAKN